mmetsp:Transcript_6445/g.10565  ORF Transcript_6445/g.10565 Transcript_6445/m.10565 type:complete len:98 (-) Transcript_6445:1041-1334(-)
MLLFSHRMSLFSVRRGGMNQRDDLTHSLPPSLTHSPFPTLGDGGDREPLELVERGISRAPVKLQVCLLPKSKCPKLRAKNSLLPSSSLCPFSVVEME